MDKKRAIDKLINDAEKLINQRAQNSTPEFIAWHSLALRFFSEAFGEESVSFRVFRERRFYPIVVVPGSTDLSEACIRDLKATVIELNQYRDEIENMETLDNRIENISNDSVFIVHGHDGEIKEAIARLLEKQGIKGIILNEKANQGQTIIEKFVRYSDVGAAIALFTSDDIGYAKDSKNRLYRARQNVVFETGYFIGKLGRDRVILVAEKGIEIPSDLQGVVYTDRNNWQMDVCKELYMMGYKIDLNKLLGDK